LKLESLACKKAGINNSKNKMPVSTNLTFMLFDILKISVQASGQAEKIKTHSVADLREKSKSLLN
jgi:hypothetical protein